MHTNRGCILILSFSFPTVPCHMINLITKQIRSRGHKHLSEQIKVRREGEVGQLKKSAEAPICEAKPQHASAANSKHCLQENSVSPFNNAESQVHHNMKTLFFYYPYLWCSFSHYNENQMTFI